MTRLSAVRVLVVLALAVTWIVACHPRGETAASTSPPVSAPTAAECEALWARYHAASPQDPFVDHGSFVARCAKSEHAVIACDERARAEVMELVRMSRIYMGDAGLGAAQEEATVTLISRMALPSRMGICVTRERARFAARTGELSELARAVATGRLRANAEGVLVAPGASATLPWRGMSEEGRALPRFAPLGEVRVRQLPDGRVWLYLLGGMLGRHQNQVGFLYSSAPFVAGDFDSSQDEARHERVFLGPERSAGGSVKESRYLLSWFTVVGHLTPQLIEVGSAPD